LAKGSLLFLLPLHLQLRFRKQNIPLPSTIDPIIASASDPLSQTGPIDSVRRSSQANKGMFQKTCYINEAYLSIVDNSLHLHGHEWQLHLLSDLNTCMDTGICNISDPRVNVTKLHSNVSDTPTFHQAMTGSDASEYIKAMQLEIHTLVQQQTWEAVPRPKDKNVLKGTWAFKLKCPPNGTPYRHKARFCARGDLQKEGVDFFETYAPVVQWSTICLLLLTVLTKGWTTQQVNYTNAFAQAEIKEEIYVEYPRLFGSKSGPGKDLCLLKSLYGLHQAPRTFFKKLKAGLQECGWKQSDINPCLFLKQGMLCAVYVDDTIFAGKSVSDIDQEIQRWEFLRLIRYIRFFFATKERWELFWVFRSKNSDQASFC
jgi:hypothetical protein